MAITTAPVAAPKVTLASDLLKSDHPAHAHFVRWVSAKGIPAEGRTLRQSRKFLAAHPYYLKTR